MEPTMDVKAMQIVYDYALGIHENDDNYAADCEVFIVWQCKSLQNWKFMLSTSFNDGMYYELTYDGDKKQWYLDAYKKYENRCITNSYYEA